MFGLYGSNSELRIKDCQSGKMVAPECMFAMWKRNDSAWTLRELHLISLTLIRQAWSLFLRTEVQWDQRGSCLSVSTWSPYLCIFHTLRIRLSEILERNFLWTSCVTALTLSLQTHPLSLRESWTIRSSELLIYRSFHFLPVLGRGAPATGCTSLAAGEPPASSSHPPSRDEFSG